MNPTILTYTGRYFPLLSPKPEDIEIEDIAHALANICRFTGHVREFYSVAQHCVLASCLVPPRDALAALLHDAAEAYVTDVSSPLKPHLGGYKDIEKRIEKAVMTRFGITEMPATVKRADMVLLVTERRDLLPKTIDADEWQGFDVIPMPVVIKPLPPAEAKKRFLERAEVLLADRNPVAA